MRANEWLRRAAAEGLPLSAGSREQVGLQRSLAVRYQQRQRLHAE